MARRFRGESTHRVDQKGRVSIPAPFRRVLEEGDPDWTEGLAPNLVVVYGQLAKPCLEAFSIRGMEAIEEAISALPFDEDRDKLERLLLTKSTYASVDETGRIVLRQDLRDRIGLRDEALFAGMGDRFQIWEPAAYAADQGEVDNSGIDPLRLLAQAQARARAGTT